MAERRHTRSMTRAHIVAARHDASDMFKEVWNLVAGFQSDDELANFLIARGDADLAKYLIMRCMSDDYRTRVPFGLGVFVYHVGMDFPPNDNFHMPTEISASTRALMLRYPVVEWIHEHMLTHDDEVDFTESIDSPRRFEEICRMLATNPYLECLSFDQDALLSTEMVESLARYLPDMRALKSIYMDGTRSVYEALPNNLDRLIQDPGHYTELSLRSYLTNTPEEGTKYDQIAAALRRNTSLINLDIHSAHDDIDRDGVAAIRAALDVNQTLMFIRVDVDIPEAVELEQFMENRRNRAGVESP